MIFSTLLNIVKTRVAYHPTQFPQCNSQVEKTESLAMHNQINEV